MFGRKSTPTPADPVEEAAARSGGKGRPTPSRKEAEAARKARLKQPRTRKERSAAARAARSQNSVNMRQAMKTGDERYLPARDRGPVKRFIRDWVDSRFTVGEILIPVLVIAMVLGYVGNRQLAVVSTYLTLLLLVVLIVNIAFMRFGLRRELKRRFPDLASYQGLTYYSIMRALQVRFLRMPKPQVKIGQKLPETYR